MTTPSCPCCGEELRFPDETGHNVICVACGRQKIPRGRSAPLEMANGLCDYECPWYDDEPYVGSLWPGETREQFGFPKPECQRPLCRAHARIALEVPDNAHEPMYQKGLRRALELIEEEARR